MSPPGRDLLWFGVPRNLPRAFGELFLAFDRLNAGFALALLGAAAFTLTACGRSGPLELPPAPATVSPTASAAPPSGPAPMFAGTPGSNGPTPTELAQKNGFDSNGAPVAPQTQKKSFPLDFLLQ
jgi:predicted small lipoprotein YifL